MGNLWTSVLPSIKLLPFTFTLSSSWSKSTQNMMVPGGPRGRQIKTLGPARSLLLLLLCHTCFALEVTVSPSHIGKVQTDVLLSCTFKVEKYPVNPQFLAIFWHFGQKELVRYDSKGKWSETRFSVDDQAVQRGNASLTIRNVTVSDKGTYKCTVVYSPNNQEKQIQLNILAIPEVRIQKNAIRSGVTSRLQCSITNFYPDNMKVIWRKNGQILSGSVIQDEKTNADMTYTRNSSINVIFLEEQGKPEIICQVEHEYLQDPIKDVYIVQYGAAPTINIKASRTPDGNEQIYMCEATNYFPEEVTMHWLLDGKKVESPAKSNDGYFNKEICYRIPLEGNNQPSQISCEVQHETLQNPIKTSEDVKVERECKRSCHSGLIGVFAVLLVTALPALWFYMKRDSQRFQVGHIHRMQTEDGRATMYCMASNCPKDVRVTWMITENNGNKIKIPDIEQKRDEEVGLIDNPDYTVETNLTPSDKFFHIISALSFTPVILKHKEMEVSCTFHCNERSREKRLKCGFTFKKPKVSGPLHLSLGDNGDVLCSLSPQNFYPKNIKIKWSYGQGQLQHVETTSETFTKNDDFTFNVRSECRVPGHLLKDQGFKVRASWSHENDSGQEEASITDSGWCPLMGEIEKPKFIDGKEAKLLCRISGYFPDALDVKWLRRDANSQELYVVSASDKYKIPESEAKQQEDKTFTYTACLIVSVSAATDYGSEYICRVRHPSLKTPLEQRTGDLSVIGIRAVNVILLDKKKLRAQVLHFTPKDIKVTWSRREEKDKKYKEYDENKDKQVTSDAKLNSDGTYTCYSEVTFKSHIINMSERKHYKLVVRHDASDCVIEKNVLRENGEYYLIDNENRKTRLAQMSDQKHGGNVNAENLEPPAGVHAVNVTLLDKKKLRAEFSHFTSKEIKITWSGREEKEKKYEEYKDKDVTSHIDPNSDGTYSGYSEITFKSQKKSITKHYKLVVRDEASGSVIEKNVLRENGEFYLIDNENRRTPLTQNSGQQHGGNTNAEHREPPAETPREDATEEK